MFVTKVKVEEDVGDDSDDCYSSLNKSSIRCQLCNYKSNRKSNFDRHMKSMHEQCNRPINCCGQVFINKASLKSHCLLYHREGYRCEDKSCNKVFPRKALLRRHQTVHNGIKEYSCGNCMYETSHKSNLERHCYRVHNLVVGNFKTQKLYNKNFDQKRPDYASPNPSQTSSYQCSSSSGTSHSESELSSSQELLSSSQEYSTNGNEFIYPSIASDNCQMTSKSLCLEVKQEMKEEEEEEEDVFTTNDYSKITDDEVNGHNKKLRLCLRPYKCLICWLLFESQFEYFEHQMLTDHEIHDSDELDVIRAAAVLTQFSISSKSRSTDKTFI